jgi:hypothetical protein
MPREVPGNSNPSPGEFRVSRHAGRAKDRRPTYAPQNLKARPVRDLGCRLLEVDWGSIEHAVLQAVLTTAPDPVPRIVEWVDVGEAQRSDTETGFASGT